MGLTSIGSIGRVGPTILWATAPDYSELSDLILSTSTKEPQLGSNQLKSCPARAASMVPPILRFVAIDNNI
jgi:hypothetical protein